MESEWTWVAVLLVSLVILCGAVTAIVFRRIATRHEKNIDQLQQRG